MLHKTFLLFGVAVNAIPPLQNRNNFPTVKHRGLDARQVTTTAGTLATGSSTVSPPVLPSLSTAPIYTNLSNSASGPTPSTTCPEAANNARNMSAPGTFIGINVTPFSPCPYLNCETPRNSSEWDVLFTRLHEDFPSLNAVRVSLPPEWGTHPKPRDAVAYLNNIGSAAKQHDVRLLLSMYRGGYNNIDFDAHLESLANVTQYGCDLIAAVSVGVDDFEGIQNYAKSTGQTWSRDIMASYIVSHMNMVRSKLRQLGCCDVPVTHSDASIELTNEDAAVNSVIDACDAFVLTSIEPYKLTRWVESMTAAQDFRSIAGRASNRTLERGKSLVLGMTGWPIVDTNVKTPNLGASDVEAAKYFHEVGCQLLFGTGSGFFGIDWDKDSSLRVPPQLNYGFYKYDSLRPEFNLKCDGYVSVTGLPAWYPKFAGGSA